MDDARNYKCNDPACIGWPKGHRHATTCKPTIPPSFREGAVLGCIFMVKERMTQAAAMARRAGMPDLAAELEDFRRTFGATNFSRHFHQKD